MNVQKKITALVLAALIVAPAFANEAKKSALPVQTKELTEQEKVDAQVVLFFILFCPVLAPFIILELAKKKAKQVPVTLDEHGLEICEINK